MRVGRRQEFFALGVCFTKSMKSVELEARAKRGGAAGQSGVNFAGNVFRPTRALEMLIELLAR